MISNLASSLTFAVMKFRTLLSRRRKSLLVVLFAFTAAVSFWLGCASEANISSIRKAQIRYVNFRDGLRARSFMTLAGLLRCDIEDSSHPFDMPPDRVVVDYIPWESTEVIRSDTHYLKGQLLEIKIPPDFERRYMLVDLVIRKPSEK